MIFRGDVARWFLLIAGPVGLALVALTPPFQAPDEAAHYFRAYQVAEGDWVPREMGGRLPPALRLTADEQVDGLPFHPERGAHPARVLAGFQRRFDASAPRETVGFNSALYAPIAYLPQGLGSLVARVVGAGPLALLYWQRLFNLLVCLALLFWALRIAAMQSLALFAIAVSPMVLFLRSSASADAMTFSLAMLFFAAVSRELVEVGPISPRRLGLLFGLIAVLALCKSVYFPLAGALLCLPAARFGGSPRKKLLVIVGLGLLALVPSVLWNASVAHLAAPPTDRADAQQQLAYLCAHPVTAATTLIGAWWTNSYFYSRSMMGVLGWLDAPIPDWANGMLWLSLALLVLTDSSRFSSAARAWVLGLVGLTAFAVVVALYLTWTRVGAPDVEGVQGRYFLPLAPAAAMALGVKVFSERRLALTLASLFAVLSTTSTIYTLLTRYWLN